MYTPFGTLTDVDARFSASILPGITPKSNRWQVLDAFLRYTDANAARVSEGTSGLLIMATIPGDPNSGKLYLYDESTRFFFILLFSDKDNFHATDFDAAVTFYELTQYIEVPRLRLAEKRTNADNQGSVSAPSQKRQNRNWKRYKQQRNHDARRKEARENPQQKAQLARV